MNRTAILVLGIFLSLALMGCSSSPKNGGLTEVPDDIGGIQRLNDSMAKKNAAAEDNHFRKELVRETALSVGARSGLAWRAKALNETVVDRADYLDVIFNFRALVLEDNVIPPVLVESRYAVNLDTPHELRVADRQYKIIKQSRFVTAAPVWQDYLIMNEKKPEMPDATLLPRKDDKEEQAIWEKFTAIGWIRGVEQADMIFAENLNRIRRDYQGMLRYRVLLAQNMVSAPQVAARDLGITGGGDEMSINDRTLVIRSLPALKADNGQWQPVVIRNE